MCMNNSYPWSLLLGTIVDLVLSALGPDHSGSPPSRARHRRRPGGRYQRRALRRQHECDSPTKLACPPGLDFPTCHRRRQRKRR
ncbi:hypothetical protein R3P38DRAFT_2871882 [Favolaschia claudopus]|uniref:Secreted protein n=1 Tax=Favolaschia claudopus TaxID=2862362 RepID=A0AAW0DCM7_9AGAR